MERPRPALLEYADEYNSTRASSLPGPRALVNAVQPPDHCPNSTQCASSRSAPTKLGVAGASVENSSAQMDNGFYEDIDQFLDRPAPK